MRNFKKSLDKNQENLYNKIVDINKRRKRC